MTTGTLSAPRVVVLGMMSRIPVPGVIWQTVHYLLGLQRLGCDVWYVEDHGMTPTAFFDEPQDDGWQRAASFVGGVMRQFGLSGRWAYHAEHGGRRHFGMSESELQALYRSAAVLINLHGSTKPRDEHIATGKLVLLETDPVELQVQLAAGNKDALEYAGVHSAFFTFGENFGKPGCGLPVTPGFDFMPTRQPVVLDFWQDVDVPARPVLTTVGNWRQLHREVAIEDQTYHWSKHLEFLRFLDLPARTNQAFELALSSCQPEDRALLEAHGWETRPPFLTAASVEDYRRFIASSYGEYTVAKDQNIRLHTGWFSDRSATYLAAGRPVLTQDTGFGDTLPTGKGLFPFLTMDEAVAAVEELRANYAVHQRGAREIAKEFFAADVVLGDLLDRIGIRPTHRHMGPASRFRGLPAELCLQSVSRWPLRLLDTTTATVDALVRSRLREAGGRRPAPAPVQAPEVSIVVVVHNGVRFTAMCLESLLADADAPAAEVVVVDNGSTDETPQLLDALHRLDGRVRVVSLNRNMGFAKGNNAGIAAARGETVVLLNNDTIVTPGWLRPLLAHLTDGAVGLVGPTTSRTCNEAEIESPYRTVGELAEFAAARWRAFAGRGFDIGMLAMFCVAGRRSTFEQIGALDESFELGLFEDDDYAMRARAAGFRLMCAEDAFVHHFGQASLGTVLDSERYDDLFNRNRARFEAKWSTKWTPHARRMSEAYVDLRDRTCRAVEELTPAGANVLVTAKGDDALLAFEGRTGGHFPGLPDGSFLGEYPADSAVAIDVLEAQRQAGAQYLVFPSSSAWWLDHYAGLRLHLHSAYGQPVASTDDLTMWSLDHAAAAAAGALGTGGGSGGAGGDGDGTDVAALRRLVAEQADALARMQAEVSALRDAVLRPNPDFSTAGGAVEKMEGGVGEDVRETWRILDRALDETGASKHTRYLLLRARLRAAVSAITPAGATIAFVSRGDDDLLDIPGRTGWHVPRMPDGAWSAGLPERGADAVRHVELVRAFGADFLVLPAPYGWWLDHYRELADHLSTHAVAKLADPELGWAWDLRAEGMADGGDVSIDAVVAGARRRLGGTDPTVLDWDSGFELAERLPDMAVFSPPVSGDELPYLDGTADLVFVGPRADGQLDEATRVAAVGVVQLQAGGGISRCTVAWKTAPGSAESTVSVVVPEGGSSDAIVRSLPAGLSGEILVPGYALAGQAGQGQRDEGQPDRSDGPDVVVRRIPPEGQPGAWAQAAAQAASGDVVVFIDPRLIPLRGWLEGLVQELGPRTDVAAATGTVMLGDALGLGVAQTAEGTNGLLAVRRSALEQAGGLPQAGSLGEACALLLERLHELGHRVTTDANAVAARIESMEKE